MDPKQKFHLSNVMDFKPLYDKDGYNINRNPQVTLTDRIIYKFEIKHKNKPKEAE
jgi:hypothetical protein